MKKICHFTSAHDPFSLRIFYKQCRTLASYGYDVTYIAPANGSIIKDGVKIKHVPEYSNWMGRLNTSLFTCLNACIKEKADLYHFHDPDLMLTGLILRALGKKVIFDIHEDYPTKTLTMLKLKNGLVYKVLKSSLYHLQDFFLKRYTHNVTVTENIFSKLGTSKKIIIGNYPIIKEIENSKTLSVDVGKNSNIRLIYTGMLTRIRGIEFLVKALEYCNENIELILLGEWEDEAYFNQCKNTDGWDKVKYLGFKKLDVTYKYVSSADIGLINFLPVENHVNSMPNKAYEYAAFGLPMIVSDFPFWRKLYSESALFVDPLDPASIASAIQQLSSNKELRVRLGSYAKDSTLKNFSWENESNKLLALYDSILSDIH